MRNWTIELQDGGTDFDGSYDRAWATCLGCGFRYRLYEHPCPVCMKQFADERIEWVDSRPPLVR